MRLARLGTVVLLAMAACGGDGSGGLPFGTAEIEGGPNAVSAAGDTLVERFGAEGAFFVVVTSLDAGFSTAQIVANAATVGSDGSIAGVTPTSGALGLLSPIDGAGAAGVHTSSWAAPRRLVVAGTSNEPQDQYVQFVGVSLGEIFANAQEHINRLSLEEEVVVATLLLGASGYSAEQIVEALITDSAESVGLCWVVTDGAGQPIQPAGAPQMDTETFCPGVFGTTTTSTTTTTTVSGGGLVPGNGALDGEYRGTASLMLDIAGWELLDSSVVAVVAGDDLSIDLVYTLRYYPRYINDQPSCTAVVTDTWSGLGFVVTGLLEIDIEPRNREIVSLTGSDCDVAYSDGTARDSVLAEFAAEAPAAVFGSVEDGTLSGEFGEFISFTATR